MGSRQSRATTAEVVTTHTQYEDDDFTIMFAINASLVDAPLPDGWEKRMTPQGMVYFIDYLTKSTTFLDPRNPNSFRFLQTSSSLLPPYEEDFYSKCQHFRALLHQKLRMEGHLEVVVDRNNMLADSVKFIQNTSHVSLTQRLRIKFEGEDGLDYGGMSREWFLYLSREILRSKHSLFKKVGYEYTINPYPRKDVSHYLDMFFFVGRIIAMALYHDKLFHSHFILPFFKQLMGYEIVFDDLKYYDKQIWKSLVTVRDSTITEDWGLSFSLNYERKLKDKKKIITIDLKEGGRDIPVTEENKAEYVELVVDFYLRSTKTQMDEIRKGIDSLVPINILKEHFSPEEAIRLLGGDKEVDLQDMRKNTEYKNGYDGSSRMITLFWEVMEGMTQRDLRSFLKFVTGTHRIPVGGFAKLYGSNGPQKLTVNKMEKSGLPEAHSCFNRLDLPEYDSVETLRKNLKFAITETKGFDLE